MNGATIASQPGIESLIEALHQERRVLERLMYRLAEANLLVEARQDRYLARASDDVSYIEARLGEVEVLRAVLVAGIAKTWEVPEEDLSLPAIIQRAEPAHAALLEKELDRLRSLTSEIDDLKRSITTTSVERLSATQRAINRLIDGPANGYGGNGSQHPAPWPARSVFRGEL